jgi:hypothetical protein
MINDFKYFCTWMYAVVDDIWLRIAPFFKRSGPAPECPDSELLAMALIGECRGSDLETEMLSQWQEHRDLFPVIPSQSRFNLIRQVVLQCLDVAQDRQCVMDRLPLPVVQFHLVPSSPSRGDWQISGSTFGKVPSKKQTIFGYKLHLLIAMNGVILDFELAAANECDLEVGFELLSEHTDLQVLGDKAYISAAKAAQLWQKNRIQLKTIPRRNQQKQLPRTVQRLYNSIRQMIETVHAQLSNQFNLEVNYAHTFWGLCSRLYTKLAAHTLCIYINRFLAKPAFLQIKALAFPI